MDDRYTIRVELFEYGYSDEKMPLSDFLAMIRETFESVPDEYKSTALFEVDYGWGDSSSTFKAYYERPENDTEYAHRKAREAAYRDESAQRELNTYLSLKAKFEGRA